LAEISRAQGEFEQAEKHYKQVLAIREQHLEADHPDRADALEGLADVYREQKSYAECVDKTLPV
jgi:tetratricopeptide (TPR) repeat protein